MCNRKHKIIHDYLLIYCSSDFLIQSFEHLGYKLCIWISILLCIYVDIQKYLLCVNRLYVQSYTVNSTGEADRITHQLNVNYSVVAEESYCNNIRA